MNLQKYHHRHFLEALVAEGVQAEGAAFARLTHVGRRRGFLYLDVHHGRADLLGQDRDRQAPRMFKVARVDAAAERIGKPGSYRVPDVDLEAAWRSLEIWSSTRAVMRRTPAAISS